MRDRSGKTTRCWHWHWHEHVHLHRHGDWEVSPIAFSCLVLKFPWNFKGKKCSQFRQKCYITQRLLRFYKFNQNCYLWKILKRQRGEFKDFKKKKKTCYRSRKKVRFEKKNQLKNENTPTTKKRSKKTRFRPWKKKSFYFFSFIKSHLRLVKCTFRLVNYFADYKLFFRDFYKIYRKKTYLSNVKSLTGCNSDLISYLNGDFDKVFTAIY